MGRQEKKIVLEYKLCVYEMHTGVLYSTHRHMYAHVAGMNTQVYMYTVDAPVSEGTN